MLDERARVLLDVAGAVTAEADVEAVLWRVLRSAKELTAARYAALGVVDASRTRLDRFLTLGVDDKTRHEIGALPSGHGVLGELIRDPRPLRVADVGGHPRSYGFPSGHPPMQTFLGVPILVGGEPYGNLYMAEKQPGGEFSEGDEEALVSLASFAGRAIEQAARFEESERQRVQLDRSVAALDASLQITRALGSETDVGRVLDLVAKRGRALVDARLLLIETREGDDLVVAAAAGEVPPGLVGQRLALAGTAAEKALGARQTQRLGDAETQARFEQRGLGLLGVDWHAGLVVPLIFRDQGFGVMFVIGRLAGEGEFNADEQRVLEAFAGTAAIAVATAHEATRQRERQRLAATEAERARWARELHDETLQGLASLRIMLGVARRADQQAHPDTEGTPAVQQALTDTTTQIGEEIQTLRSLITELRPAALETGLHGALAALAERSRRNGLEVTLTADLPSGRGPTGQDTELDLAVYRIVQEALTNARRHGHTTHATVDVAETQTCITITVTDNGSGFDPTMSAEGYGLLGMAERVSLLHGTVNIESAPGEGTVVRATLPTQPSTAVSPG